MSAHFDELGAAKGLPSGAPREFDAAYYRHQLPGGMVTTTRRMLEELRRPELFDAVLEEVSRVRAEMGYPIIVTPVSQFIASQAARNVIDGERWANVSDETVRFFLGHYGEPPAPVDPQIADRVLSRPQARALAELEPLSLEGARERFGTRISDEELLLRLTMPAEQVDAMVAARERRRRRRRDGATATGSEPARRSSRCCPSSSAGRTWRSVSVVAGADRSSGAVVDGLDLGRVRGVVFDVDGTLVHRGRGRSRPAAARRGRGARAHSRQRPQARGVHERQPSPVGADRPGAARRRPAGRTTTSC